MTWDNDTPGRDVFQGAGVTAAAGWEAVGCQTPAEHPPTVIRGCKLQIEDNGSTAAIGDWFAFTLPCVDGELPKQRAEWLLAHFGCPYDVRQYGKNYYSNGFDLSIGGFILFHPQRSEMGVHCSLPSSALGQLNTTLLSLIAMVIAEGGAVTRLDVALDTGHVTLDQVKQAWADGNAVKHSTHSGLQSGFKDGPGHRPKLTGETLYIGSRQSEAFARFYDKAKELGIDDGSVRTRCEIEFKGKRAQAAAVAILEGADLEGLIVSVVDFRDRAADSNVSRCPRLPWWDEWVSSARRVVFPVAVKLAQSVEQAYSWVQKQVGPTLAFLDQFFRKDPLWLYRLCDANAYRMRPELRALLATEGG